MRLLTDDVPVAFLIVVTLLLKMHAFSQLCIDILHFQKQMQQQYECSL